MSSILLRLLCVTVSEFVLFELLLVEEEEGGGGRAWGLSVVWDRTVTGLVTGGRLNGGGGGWVGLGSEAMNLCVSL